MIIVVVKKIVADNMSFWRKMFFTVRIHITLLDVLRSPIRAPSEIQIELVLAEVVLDSNSGELFKKRPCADLTSVVPISTHECGMTDIGFCVDEEGENVDDDRIRRIVFKVVIGDGRRFC
jgi:hypothetical protein